MNPNNQLPRASTVLGFAMIEVVVAAGILLTVISFAMQMMFRADHNWSDIGQHRVAIQELSNQLDRLTLLPLNEVADQLNSLQPSDDVSATLHNGKLSGELSVDELGQRLVLRLNWERRYSGKPIEMTCWLRQTQAASQSAASAAEAPP